MSILVTTNPAYPNGLNPLSGDEVVSQDGVIRMDARLLSDAVNAAPGMMTSMGSGLPAPDDGDVTLGVVQGTRSALNAVSSDTMVSDATAVMELLFKISIATRTSERERARAATANATDATFAGAEEMVKAADNRFQGATVAAAMQIGGGALQIGAAGVGAAYAASGFKQTKISGDKTVELHQKGLTRAEYGDIKKSIKDADGLAQEYGQFSQTALGIGQGGSSALAGAGQMANAHDEHDAALADAMKMRLQASQTSYEGAAEANRKTKEQADQTIQGIRDFTAAMEQSRTESLKSISRNL